jgi:N-methylhydantoinase A/oxoprolinase/acetone carboxylase beta subunit
MTQMKGYDCSAHVLACFGGAGGQHACAIARSLGMSTVFVHRYSVSPSPAPHGKKKKNLQNRPHTKP